MFDHEVRVVCYTPLAFLRARRNGGAMRMGMGMGATARWNVLVYLYDRSVMPNERWKAFSLFSVHVAIAEGYLYLYTDVPRYTTYLKVVN